jgi:NAD(P)-dependent dehydrogenase (short-subunit alcohol dehydrogenase family)
MISNLRSVLPQEYLRIRYAWFWSTSATSIRMFGQLAKGAAVGYVGQPSDIAELVSFLASKESHLITGQSVSTSAPFPSAPFV